MTQEYTARWANRRYLGRWVDTSDVTSPVMEPATGATLLDVADATPVLVRESAAQAADGNALPTTRAQPNKSALAKAGTWRGWRRGIRG